MKSYNFSYRGIPSYEFGLMRYDFDNTSHGNGIISSPIKVVEEKLPRRYASLYLGKTQNEPLSFPLIFGVDVNSINTKKSLDRFDIEAVATWLTAVDGYDWLEFEQPDLETVRYKCIITNLEILEVGWCPLAFKATVVCDSPFAYMYPEEHTYTTTTTKTINFYNKSSSIDYYKPIFEITLPAGISTVSIVNQTDSNREFKFTSISNPSGIIIYVDNENQIITSSTGANMYQYFNFKYFQLKKGDNTLVITGNNNLKITCEFPVNVGG